jgi:hypothetical protein
MSISRLVRNNHWLVLLLQSDLVTNLSILWGANIRQLKRNLRLRLVHRRVLLVPIVTLWHVYYIKTKVINFYEFICWVVSISWRQRWVSMFFLGQLKRLLVIWISEGLILRNRQRLDIGLLIALICRRQCLLLFFRFLRANELLTLSRKMRIKSNLQGNRWECSGICSS